MAKKEKRAQDAAEKETLAVESAVEAEAVQAVEAEAVEAEATQAAEAEAVQAAEEEAVAVKESKAEAEESDKSLSDAEIEKQIKPLSNNAFLRFFQKLFRAYLTMWHGFADKHPKASKWVYTIGFFVIFSQGVTIFQFLIFLSFPHIFGIGLAQNDWQIPKLLMGTDANGNEVFFSILGNPVLRDSAGNVIIGGGLGYFMAFALGTFLAQCINFPLQRNITFRSHGNVYYQLMWYFIGWVLIQPATMALGSAWKGLVAIHMGSWPAILLTLLDTIIMGGVAMGIFFVIFMIIFPDYNKVAQNLNAKLQKLQAAGASGEQLQKAKLAAEDAELKAKVSNAEKEARKTESQASAKAIGYFATMKQIEKNQQRLTVLDPTKHASAIAHFTAQNEKLQALVPTRKADAAAAIAAKDKAAAEFLAAKAEKESFDASVLAAA